MRGAVVTRSGVVVSLVGVVRAIQSVVLVLLVCLGLGASQVHANPKTRTYTVQPGDSIWSIAEEFYGNGNKYKIIYEHNKFIGSPPFILKPGQVLTLPTGQLSPEAQVEWTKREVKAKPPRSLDWLRANNKMNLWKLYQVSTGGDSAVHIVFEDASDLRMGEDALLVIYSGSSKNAKTKAQQKTQVLLKEGTVRGGLAALDGPAPAAGATGTPAPAREPMVVETPAGVVELLSSLAQVQANAEAAIVSVYEGEVAVKGQGETVKVKKGQGTVVAKGKKPEAPTPLPASPEWEVEEGGLALVPDGGRASIEAAWKPVDTARHYRVELAHDAAFKQVAVNVEVSGETRRLKLDNIPAGKYFVRVAARDQRKLEGVPSKALPVDVVAVGSSRRMEQNPADGVWEVTALTRLGLGPAGEGLEWSLDDGAFVSGRDPHRVAKPGLAKLKVRRAASAGGASGNSGEFVFRMLAVVASFEFPGVADGTAPRIAAEGEALPVVMVLRDERGRPAPLPELKLEADPGGALSLEEVGPGRFSATLPAPAAPGPESMTLAAKWLDGVVGVARVEVDRKLPDEPYRYAWREAVTGLAWDGRLASTSLPSVTPIDRVGVLTQVVDQGGEGHFITALTAEVGLIEERLGLDLGLSLFRPPLSRDRSQENEVGDLTFGARYLVFRDERWAVAPSLRMRAPLKERDGTQVLGLEPGVLVRYRAGRRVWLDMRQAALLSPDLKGDGSATSWVSDYAVLYRPLGWLSLSGQLATSFVFDSTVGDKAPGAAFGLGALFHVDRLRFGLQVGLGLGDGGTSRFGDLAIGLSLDVGLGTP